jgi:hypothetical protein
MRIQTWLAVFLRLAFNETMRGFSSIEALVSITLLGLIVFVLMHVSTGLRNAGDSQANRGACANVVNGITQSLRAIENTMTVRNWQPKASPTPNGISVNDPYCDNTNNRTPVCDQFPMLRYVNTYVDQTRYGNFQNVRSAAVWAQSLYNSLKPAICTNTGVSYTRDSLSRLLPKNSITLPMEFDTYELFISDMNVGCGQVSDQRTRMQVQIRGLRTGGSAEQACVAKDEYAPNVDSYPATLTAQVRVSGVLVPQDACTAQPGVPADGISYRNVEIQVEANEPGVIFLCRKESSFDSFPLGKWVGCQDYTDNDATSVVLTGLQTPTYNQPTRAVLKLSELTPRGTDTYKYQVMAVDVGGNESKSVEVRFQVRACP